MNLRPSSFATGCLAIAFALASAASVSAQGVPASASGLDISSSIQNPLPGQQITITAKSYSIDINAATVVWVVDNRIVERGIGATTLQTTAPDLGKTLDIAVTAAAADGTAYQGSIVIGSGSVDMIVEPEGYVPPMFEGRVPAAFQSSVKVVAIPHIADASGTEYDPSKLVYHWQSGDTVLESSSGYGKDWVVVQNSLIPRPFNVSVTVTSRDGSAQAYGITGITAGSPSIQFYYDDSLYGPEWNRAIGSTAFLGAAGELRAIAAPFGVTAPDLTYGWTINGTPHPELSGSQTATFRLPGGSAAAGSSQVGLEISSAADILQHAVAGFTAVWNANAASQAAQAVTF